MISFPRRVFRQGLVSLAICLILMPLTVSAVIVDGAFTTADNYSVVFDASFVENGQQLDGGFIAFGEDALGQYLYFAFPKDFVDNSYGANSIGWGGHTHTFKELVTSDNSSFTFHTQTAAGEVFAVLDYLSGDGVNVNSYNVAASADPTADWGSCGAGYDDGNPATINDVDYNNHCANAASAGGIAPDPEASQIVIDVATSLEYNLTQHGGETISTGEYVHEVSPYADPDYTNPETGFEDWIYELAYEIHFAPNTFDPTAWSTVTADTIMSLVEISDPHASPAKLGDGTPDVVCFDCTQRVPVGSSLWLMLAGLVGWGLVRRVRLSVDA